MNYEIFLQGGFAGILLFVVILFIRYINKQDERAQEREKKSTNIIEKLAIKKDELQEARIKNGVKVQEIVGETTKIIEKNTDAFIEFSKAIDRCRMIQNKYKENN